MFPCPTRWEAQARTGRYSNASDYVRDLIRKEQERAAHIARLQTLITEGLESGIAEDFSMDAIQTELDNA